MKKIILFASILFSSACLFVQNATAQDNNAQTRNVSSFHQVEVSSGIHLYLKQGNAIAVSVSASSPEISSRIKTEVENGRLKIYIDRKGITNWDSKGKNLKAYVTIKDIDALEVNSGADAETDGNINSNELKISLSSGAGFSGAVTASKLWVDQSSGSDMLIKGKVGEASVKTSSGANFKGYDLESETCNADASSGSGIEITVNKELNAIASSGGGIDYKGNAAVKSISNSSGGRIKKQS